MRPRLLLAGLVAATAGCGSGVPTTAPPSGTAPSSTTATSVSSMTLPGAVTAPGLTANAPPDPACALAPLVAAARTGGLSGIIVAHTCVGSYASAAATVAGSATTIGFGRSRTGWKVLGEGNVLPVSTGIPPGVIAELSTNLAQAPPTDGARF